MTERSKRILRGVLPPLAVIAAALLLRGAAYSVESVFLGQLANAGRIFLYLGLFAVWGVSVYRRVVQLQVRRYLVAVSVLMVLWLTLREFRWHYVLGALPLRRLWYAYYIFTLLIPLLALFVSLSLGKPAVYRLPRRAALLYIPVLSLIALVQTNDLHRLVFRFPADAALWTEWDYSYGPGYYCALACGVLCALAAFAVMLTRCRLPRTGTFLWLPLLPFGAAVVYVVLYAMRLPFVRHVLDDVTVMECLLFAAFFECCIRCGLIQSNTRYHDLFSASEGITALITDRDYRVRYASAGAAEVPREEMERAEAGPLILPGGLRLNNMPVNGGHAVWTEDISELLARREELETVREELIDRNEIVRMEYASEKERLTVEEQNRLYDLLQRNTQVQLDKARLFAAAYEREKEPQAKRVLLAKIVVLGCYIKRRKDMTLSLVSAPILPPGTLEGALGESFASLEKLSIRGGYYVDKRAERLPGALLARAYDFFEDVLERVMDAARFLHVRVGLPGGTLRCAVGADAGGDAAPLLEKYPALRVNYDEDGGAEFILTFPEEAEG